MLLSLSADFNGHEVFYIVAPSDSICSTISGTCAASIIRKLKFEATSQTTLVSLLCQSHAIARLET